MASQTNNSWADPSALSTQPPQVVRLTEVLRWPLAVGDP